MKASAKKAWCSSILARWSISEWTPATGVGPVLVGIAHSDYSDAEIEAWIEQTTGWTEGDLVAAEVRRRKVRKVGIFGSPAGAGIAAEAAVLKDGEAIRTKLGWQLTTSQTLRVWGYNLGTQAFATTSPQIQVQGHANLWPN